MKYLANQVNYKYGSDQHLYRAPMNSYPQSLSTSACTPVDTISHAVPTSTYALSIDKVGTMHSARQGPLGLARAGIMYLLGGLCLLLGSPEASASSTINTDYLKLYSHFKIVDSKQYECFNAIITKESMWNPTARNGSHWGLGQMRSKWYGKLSPYEQIDATLRYIDKRYSGSSCKAWAFHMKRGYY